MDLKLKNGQFKDFASLFVAYEMLPERKQNPDVRENIKSAMIAAGLQKLTNKQERERMYDPEGEWLGVINYVEENNANLRN